MLLSTSVREASLCSEGGCRLISGHNAEYNSALVGHLYPPPDTQGSGPYGRRARKEPVDVGMSYQMLPDMTEPLHSQLIVKAHLYWRSSR